MTTHNLTTEQMQKFFDAVGGIPKTEITGGSFTTEQLKKLIESIDCLHDWPQMTDDPMVNFAIDCVVENDGEEPIYSERLYADEAESFRVLIRKKRARKLGLPETATYEEINEFISNRDRKRCAKELGLPEIATWKEINEASRVNG